MSKSDCFGLPGNEFYCNKNECGNVTMQLCLAWSREMREQKYHEEWKKEKDDEKHAERLRRGY